MHFTNFYEYINIDNLLTRPSNVRDDQPLSGVYFQFANNHGNTIDKQRIHNVTVPKIDEGIAFQLRGLIRIWDASVIRESVSIVDLHGHCS